MSLAKSAEIKVREEMKPVNLTTVPNQLMLERLNVEFGRGTRIPSAAWLSGGLCIDGIPMAHVNIQVLTDYNKDKERRLSALLTEAAVLAAELYQDFVKESAELGRKYEG